MPSLLPLSKYNDIISSEVNVKQVEYSSTLDGFGKQTVVLNSKNIAPALGQKFQRILSLVKSGEWAISNDRTLVVEGQIIDQKDYEVKVLPKPGLASKSLETAKGLVILDIAITQQLWEEGLIRDFIRIVQSCRKEMNLFFTEQIGIEFSTDIQLEDIILRFAEYIKSQIFADYIIEKLLNPQTDEVHEDIIGNSVVKIKIVKT